MKKNLPLLLLLSYLTIKGQKRINSEPKSYSLLSLMNADKKIRYIRNNDNWMTSAETLPENYKKTTLYSTQSFNTTRLNKTGRLKNIILPSRLKLPLILGRYVFTGFLPKIHFSFAVNPSLYS